MLIRHWYPSGRHIRAFVATGVIGAFTTFSTFTFETVSRAEQGSLRLAIRNAILRMTSGLTAAVIGLAVTSF